MEFNVGDIVKLPLNETGKIVRINTNGFDWFPYKVKIRKAVFNKTNQIIGYKSEQLEKM